MENGGRVIQFPYGKDMLTLEVEEERYGGLLESKINTYAPEKSEQEMILEALQNPIESELLRELARGKQHIVIIASDHTRPVPSKLIIPPMLSEIRKGNPEAWITILIATGCHRETSREELVMKFGEEIVEHEKIVIHDCDDAENLVSVGTLPSGGELIVNRLAAEADLIVSEGFIEPHFFAGFSGGRKSILPGICARSTVLYNHNAAFINHPNARTGMLEGNPIHEDMRWAAQKVGLSFICNVVLNSEKKVVHAVAGAADAAHREGCAFLNRLCCVDAAPSDLVITTNGGYPLDQNIYQAVKGMTAAEATVREGGVIIMLAASQDGHGGAAFYETFKKEANLHRMTEKFLSTRPEETIVDQWQSQIFARVLMHASVIYVSEADDEIVCDLHMIPAHSITDAIEKADGLLDEKGIEKARILSIPDGVSVIVNELHDILKK